MIFMESTTNTYSCITAPSDVVAQQEHVKNQWSESVRFRFLRNVSTLSCIQTLNRVTCHFVDNNITIQQVDSELLRTYSRVVRFTV